MDQALSFLDQREEKKKIMFQPSSTWVQFLALSRRSTPCKQVQNCWNQIIKIAHFRLKDGKKSTVTQKSKNCTLRHPKITHGVACLQWRMLMVLNHRTLRAQRESGSLVHFGLQVFKTLWGKSRQIFPKTTVI